jgi:hypothetical protein
VTGVGVGITVGIGLAVTVGEAEAIGGLNVGSGLLSIFDSKSLLFLLPPQAAKKINKAVLKIT